MTTATAWSSTGHSSSGTALGGSAGADTHFPTAITADLGLGPYELRAVWTLDPAVGDGLFILRFGSGLHHESVDYSDYPEHYAINPPAERIMAFAACYRRRYESDATPEGSAYEDQRPIPSVAGARKNRPRPGGRPKGDQEQKGILDPVSDAAALLGRHDLVDRERSTLH